MNKIHVKAGDSILVLSGKDRGKKGKVIEVNSKTRKVLVEGVNMATKHAKPKAMNQQGGIIHQEAPIDASNVMLICPKCKKPARTGYTFIENGRKARTCKKCNEVINFVKKAK